MAKRPREREPKPETPLRMYLVPCSCGKSFAVAENYPDLKANNNFLQLQSRITQLESQIADRREFYNDSVNTYNIRIQQVPDAFVAGFLAMKPRPMFKAEAADKADVPLAFGATAK